MQTAAQSRTAQAIADAIVSINRRADESAALDRIRRRTARRKTIRRLEREGYWSVLGWLAAYPAHGRLLSLDEAIAMCEREIVRARLAHERGHWSAHDKMMLVPCWRDKLIVARFFRRFSKDIWAREAA